MSEPAVVSSCKDCVFATYKGTTQIGCKLDRVEKFRTNGVGVQESYDEDREFFVIQGLCTLNKHKKSPWAMAHPARERMAVARSEIRVEVDFVIVLDGEKTVADAKVTVDSLLAQTLLPLKVTVVVNREGVAPNLLRNILPADWVATVVLERGPNGERVGFGRCVDIAVHGSKAHYYALFSPGFAVPPTFVFDIDKSINEDLMRFCMLEPNARGEGLVVQTMLHRYVGGHFEAFTNDEAGKSVDGVAEKVRHVAEATGTSLMVKKVGEVCPSMGE